MSEGRSTPITATAIPTVPAETGVARPADTIAQPDPELFALYGLRVATCTNPVHLRGQIAHIDIATGEVRQVYSSDDQPTGVLLVPCGNRRAARCPSCAETYRRDAYQLLRAGLAGGKGIPATVREHPAVFATFTAPSFGPVHAHRTSPTGRILPCRPRRTAPPCPHGLPTQCRRVHPADDPTVGEPLCARCYDYQAHVLWNALAGRLWSRTTIYISRALAHIAGLPHSHLKQLVRIRFAKVAEYQARGVIHFHAVIRADQAPDSNDPESKQQVSPPPAWLTAELLAEAVRQAATTVRYRFRDSDQLAPAVWGPQLDLRPITTGRPGGPGLSAEAVAGYIAKYATAMIPAVVTSGA